MPRSEAARALIAFVLIEMPLLIVLGGVVQIVFGDGLEAGAVWHVLGWLLTASGVLGVAAILGLPALRQDDVSLMDFAVPLVAIGLLATSAILAAKGLYSWTFWVSGVGIGVALVPLALVFARRAEHRAMRDAEETLLDQRDHERRLAAHGDAQRIL